MQGAYMKVRDHTVHNIMRFFDQPRQSLNLSYFDGCYRLLSAAIWIISRWRGNCRGCPPRNTDPQARAASGCCGFCCTSPCCTGPSFLAAGNSHMVCQCQFDHRVFLCFLVSLLAGILRGPRICSAWQSFPAITCGRNWRFRRIVLWVCCDSELHWCSEMLRDHLWPISQQWRDLIWPWLVSIGLVFVIL